MSCNTINKKLRQKLLQKSGIMFFNWDIKTDLLSLEMTFETLFPRSGVVTPKTGKEFYKKIKKDDRSKIKNLLLNIDSEANVDIDIRYSINESQTAWLRINITKSGLDSDEMCGTLQNITIDKNNFLKTAYTAYTDDLTGLLNRARMKQKLALALGTSNKNNVQYAFMIFSIDNLASINSMFGHNITDDIIQAVGYKLCDIKRKTDVIARLSSGKFAILLVDIEKNLSPESLNEIGHRFIKNINETSFFMPSGSLYITTSGAGCIIKDDIRTVDDVFIIADETLSKSKMTGNNIFTTYQSNNTKSQERLENISLSGKIVNSVKKDLIQGAFQPVINQQNYEQSFFEVLARIKEEDGSLIPAFKFIPVAENTGFIRMIDMRILEIALKKLEKTPHINLSVNISGITLSNYCFYTNILNKLDEYKHLSSRLIVEITETVALQDIHGMDQFIAHLKQMGYKIALDDFGAGYNSFSNLKSYDFDIVKIDGSYIKGIHKNKKSQTFVKALAQIGQELNVKVVAEMISEDEDIYTLQQYPIEYYQGFMFGKPELDLGLSLENMKSSLSYLSKIPKKQQASGF